MNGIHEAFVALGIFTLASSAIFWSLKDDDGRSVSRQVNRVEHKSP
jgi:hypothetical protein